jgi:hypothetical protein
MSLVALLSTAVLSVSPGPGQAAEPLKIISAVRAAAPPILDGVLDEACWNAAEVREDFTPLVAAPPGRTAVRCVYDRTHLYVGVECFSGDPAGFRRGVADLKEKAVLHPGWLPTFDGFVNSYSVELFLDPGRTLRSHYQFLFNAAGQTCGHYRNRWGHPFSPVPSSACRVEEDCWRAEFVFPVQEGQRLVLEPGEEWGINFARNDSVPLAIWRPIAGAWNEPKEFGRLMIGSYAEWWEARWTRGAKVELARWAKAGPPDVKKNPTVIGLYRLAQREAEKLDTLARQSPPVDRARFAALYVAYQDYCRHADRLLALGATLEKMR